MAKARVDLPPKGGFSFDLCRRNEMLTKKGIQLPGFRKTGTTIVGLIFEDGVILGADTRATEGPIVADKNCEKIHYMAPNIYCCGAGTAADTEAVTDMVSSQLQLHRYATRRESRVITALTLLKSHLFSYQGHVSAALVLGGVDVTGPHLHTVYPHGSTDTLPFATMGSGSLAAMAVFESKYKEGLTNCRDKCRRLEAELQLAGNCTSAAVRRSPVAEEGSREMVVSRRKRREIASCSSRLHLLREFGEWIRELAREDGIQLVGEAICSGIFNDLGSGSNVDVCVITKGKTDYLRNHQLPNPRTYISSRGYSFDRGYTEVLSTKITPLKLKAEVVENDAMEE
ncbi:Proteasome subunit beta type-7-B [Platanthera guangdongensis]|uniref:proteasome endopeptidase complex n=1 Tax=Platanthera guangdongensis TaxID=2320717 RepID=A0ABR2LTW0_9ASPA